MILFVKGFDNLRSQSVAPPQWTMRNVDDRYYRDLLLANSNFYMMEYVFGSFSLVHDAFLCCRNRLLLFILNICKDVLGHLPKVVGIDVVEMALWAKAHMNMPQFYILKLDPCFSCRLLCSRSKNSLLLELL